MAKTLRNIMQIEMMQQEDGRMRMPQAVAGDGRDAGSDACMTQALIHCIHRDRIPIDADKDKPVRILKTALERCLFHLIVIGFEERNRHCIHADRSVLLVLRRFEEVSTVVVP